jgi:multidrug resistance efflux pump
MLEVFTQLTGKVISVPPLPGSRVRAGDILIQLDTHDLIAKRSSLLQRIDLLELHYADASRLYHALEQTQLDLTRLTITAPADGRIVWLLPLHPGSALHAGTRIAILQKKFE